MVNCELNQNLVNSFGKFWVDESFKTAEFQTMSATKFKSLMQRIG